MKQRAEITFEIEEKIFLREGSKILTAFCPGCGGSVLMASPQAISILANVSERTIFRLIEAGEVHFIEKDGIFVCLSSAVVCDGVHRV